MLYLVGGASRSGKTSLARRLLLRRKVPYFSLDVLMMGLAKGVPAFGVDPEASGRALGEMLWPLVRAMAANLFEEAPVHPSYLLEGVQLLPSHVAELGTGYAGQVAACFLGYGAVDPASKLEAVRRREPGWCSHYTEAEALAFVAGEVEFSRWLQAECERCGLPYFDEPDDPAAAVAAAYDLLVGHG
jgi:hypothetical protein